MGKLPPKVEKSGMAAPKPAPPTGPHISPSVREALKDIDPELAAGVRRVANTK